MLERKLLYDKIKSIIEEAINYNHRRLFILEDGAAEYLIDILGIYHETVNRSYSILISGKEDREEAIWIKPYVDFAKAHEDRVKWGYVPLKALERIMGTTWDFLIADLSRDLRPNDLGRLIEVVRGGGLIVFLAPRRDAWKSQITMFHHDMVTSPFTLKDIKPIFMEYFVKTMERSPGIWFISPDGSITGTPVKETYSKREEKVIPKITRFPKLVYEMAASQDQVRVIKAIENMVDGGYVVITANRGRGKSVAIGLALAGIVLTTSNLNVILTAPEFTNVRELINYFILTLTKLDIKPKFSDGKQEIKVNGSTIRYIAPYNAWREKGDIVIVDEAAGIPVYLLERLLGNYKLHIFSSTLHGYEGAGRGFQVRFIPSVRKKGKDKFVEVRMSEPIRYSPGDPIERWLYDALLLDSDPIDIDEREIRLFDRKKLTYTDIDLKDWLINKKNMLKEYIGIYIYAHYRNRPNDIMILCDAPHHFAACLLYNNKVVNSLHLSLEGRMTKEDVEATLAGEPPSGHLIPTVMLRYYPVYKEVSDLRGIRIVRIATHPDLMNRGIGSKAIYFVVSKAKEMGMDWVGSSFGVTEELLNFWANNGFFPVHISPNKNPISGEYSVIVIRPLSKKAIQVFRNIRLDFKRGFLDSLIDPHFTLDPKIAYRLLSIDPWTINVYPRLTNTQKARLKEYVWGAINYAGAYDAIVATVKAHFMRSPNKRIEIPRKYEYALISKVLQARSWDTVAANLGMTRGEVMDKFREIIGRMRLAYVEK